MNAFLIDCNMTDEEEKYVVDAITHSVKRIFLSDIDVVIQGQCTDSGGGSTKYVLKQDFDQHNIVSENYLVSTCSLHNLQTCLRNSVVMVLGEGGKDESGNYSMTVMQMLHGAYNLQNWQEDDELKLLWSYLSDEVSEKNFRKLEDPILT